MQRQSDWTGILVIALVGVVLFGAVDYSGDYAINDDWGYATPVRWWVEDGRLALTHWQSMPLLTQLAMGIGWAEIFGYSPESLRRLTLTLALVASLSVYGLARRLDLSPGPALLAALLPLASPIFLGLSYTFMTDVPFAAVLLISTLCFAQSFRSGGVTSFALGVVFLLLAILLRQTALALAVALVLAEPMARGFSLLRVLRSIAVLVVSVSLYWITADAIADSIGLPYYYELKTDAVLRFALAALRQEYETLLVAPQAILRASALFGLTLLPVLPFLWPKRGQMGFLGVGTAIILIAGLTWASARLETGVFFAAPGDMLTAEGLGPRHLEGRLPDGGLWAIAASGLGHAVTILALFTALRRQKSPPPARTGIQALLFLTGAILYAPHVVADTWNFDRYALLPAILLSLVVLSRTDTDRPAAGGLSTGLVAVGLALSLVLVHDFFRWQDARYDLIASLDRPASEIDGGFEFNNRAVLLTDPPEAHALQLVSTRGRPIRIVHRPRLADTVLDQREVPQLLGLRTAHIYAVE